ncbi:MAG: RnfABCDGE type electron transport complex subunit B [Lachnospiraceae bacterium]|nr:RnfABCDGE type electron transport complex subunit B [Lachnospiraceae bacterium]
MNVTGIITAVAIVGGVGLLISIFLSFFGNYFKVEVDEKEEAVLNALPGNNCGGCGYPGCSGLAAAIAKGEAPVNGCPVGGANVASEIAKIMGQDVGDMVKQVAYVKCKGNCQKAKDSYEYHGLEDCVMAAGIQAGGPKACDYGCLGYGSCKKACQFGAISIVDGIAVVDKEKCTSCGKCIATCPKNLIELIPYDAAYAVGCSSHDKGPVVMKACEQGCIGCGICAKNCPTGAITVTDFVAHIDQSKCTRCGLCQEKCPKKVIFI